MTINNLIYKPNTKQKPTNSVLMAGTKPTVTPLSNTNTEDPNFGRWSMDTLSPQAKASWNALGNQITGNSVPKAPTSSGTVPQSTSAPVPSAPQAPAAPEKPVFDEAKYRQGILDNATTQVNAIFDKQNQARMAQLKATREKALGQLNQQKSQVAPQYQGMRNQTDVVNFQNAQRLREMMANAGLTSTGENVSATVAMNNERVNSLNKLNLQEQETLNDFNRRIAEVNDPNEENALYAALEAQRAEALYNAYNRADDRAYQRSRDVVADDRYTDERDYARGRDTVADNRYTEETTYNRGRDKVADDRYTEETTYNRGRDKVADDRYTDETTYNRGQDTKEWAWREDEKKYGRTRDRVADQRYTDETNYNRGRDRVADQRYTDETKYNRGQDQKQWNYQIGRDKVSDQRYVDEVAYDRRMQQQRFALNQQKETRISSGGSSKGGSSKTNNGTVVKPKTASQNKLDSTSYWADQKGQLDYYGPDAMERAILNDPNKIKEITSQGYDINTFIDSMWNIATNGRFKTKKEYTKYLESVKKGMNDY